MPDRILPQGPPTEAAAGWPGLGPANYQPGAALGQLQQGMAGPSSQDASALPWGQPGEERRAHVFCIYFGLQ